jgi:hypothetical protein
MLLKYLLFATSYGISNKVLPEQPTRRHYYNTQNNTDNFI